MYNERMNSDTTVNLQQMACARIPTRYGEFQLCLYRSDWDAKDHLALTLGDVTAPGEVLVRVHSECFTGDVLGSRRCDCGEQLEQALQRIAATGRGVLIYLRQEGRGIGLLDKLRAYNLQDAGYDTVDANLMLGHQPDSRDYTVAAHILRFLQVPQVRLLTNNPAKLEGLRQLGIDVVARDPLQVPPNAENAGYLAAKARRMRHLLTLADDLPAAPGRVAPQPAHPYVTLSYAQSLDGAISLRRGQPTALSGPQALAMTHQLRAEHDAILVGIGTVLADDPRLTVRLVSGPDPQPVVVDSQLRLPPTARLLQNPRPPWIATTAAADPGREATLTAAGARILRLPGTAGQVNLPALLHRLHELGISRLMVEGGATIINNFLAARLVDHLVVTVTPALLGGLPAVHNLGPAGTALPRLHQPHYQQLGRDLIVSGDVVWEA